MLYGENLNRASAIASTTKLMTALIVLEHVHRLGTMFTEPNYYAGPHRFADRTAARGADERA